MTQLITQLVTWYQKLVSPDHSVWGRTRPDLHCRFFPTCSEYAKESLKTHGVLRGGFLSVARVCRCHPWGAQGVDPVLNLENN